MATRTLTLTVPENIGVALAPLDGSLRIDSIVVEQMLRDVLLGLGRDLVGIAEGGEDVSPEELRDVACRVGQVAATMDEIDGNAGNMLARVRKQNGWTRSAMAEWAGVDVGTVAAWEAGTAIPSHDLAHRMANEIGFAVDYLLGVGRLSVVEDLPLVCARCGDEAPGNPERFEQGWDVAGGKELVCADCLTPSDLEW